MSKDNIELALKKACKPTGKITKAKRRAIARAKQNKDTVIESIYQMFEEGKYRTSPYNIYPLYDPKLRLIYSLPLYPDRIVHHCILNILESYWDNLMIFDSYACRSKKNTHKKGQHQAGTKAGLYAIRSYKKIVSSACTRCCWKVPAGNMRLPNPPERRHPQPPKGGFTTRLIAFQTSIKRDFTTRLIAFQTPIKE